MKHHLIAYTLLCGAMSLGMAYIHGYRIVSLEEMPSSARNPSLLLMADFNPYSDIQEGSAMRIRHVAGK